MSLFLDTFCNIVSWFAEGVRGQCLMLSGSHGMENFGTPQLEYYLIQMFWATTAQFWHQGELLLTFVCFIFYSGLVGCCLRAVCHEFVGHKCVSAAVMLLSVKMESVV